MQPVADGAPAALVVVPVGAAAVGKPAGRRGGLAVTGKSLKFGNVWVFVQLMSGPRWPMNLLNKNANIA